MGLDIIFQEAKTAAREGRINAAVTYLREAVQREGGASLDIVEALESVLGEYGGGKLDDVARQTVRSFAEDLAKEPPSRQISHALGLMYDLAGEKEKAKSFYRRAVDLDPDNERFTYDYLLMLINDNQLREAVSCFEATTAQFKATRGADVLASYVRDRGYVLESLSIYHMLANATTGIHKAWHLTSAGCLYERLGDREKAKKAYSEAVAVEPNYAYPLVRLAQIEGERSNFSEAIKYCQQAIRANKDMVEALLLMGWLHYKQSEYKRAIEFYAEYYVSSRVPKALERIGYCFYMLEEYGHASQILSCFHRKSSGSAESWARFGRCLLESHQFTDAIPALHKALEFDPNNHEALESLVKAYVEMDQYQELIDTCKNYIEKVSPTPDILIKIGYAHLQLGEMGKARETFAEAMELSRSYVSARELIAMVYLESNDRAAFLDELSVMKILDRDVYESLRQSAQNLGFEFNNEQ